jgi:hypothetical protein
MVLKKTHRNIILRLVFTLYIVQLGSLVVVDIGTQDFVIMATDRKYDGLQ